MRRRCFHVVCYYGLQSHVVCRNNETAAAVVVLVLVMAVVVVMVTVMEG